MVYVTRAEWGARPARSGPGQLSASQVEAMVLHWPAMARPLRGVGPVSAALRGWQNFHMDGHGWSDIAYQEAVDQDGNVYGLRGLRTQSAANGDQDVNERYGALLLILAPGEQPSDLMLAMVRQRVEVHRELYPRSRRVVGHSDVRPEPTQCPGPIVLQLAHAGAFEPGAGAPKLNRVQRGRRAIRRGLEQLADAPNRPAVAAMAEKVRDALRAGPHR